MKNSYIVYITIIALVLIISIPTAYTVYKNHNDKLYEVVYNEIEYAAKKCYYDGICKDEKTKLKYLYDNKYLEKQSDPITKEYYSEDSYVLKDNKTFKFVEVK